jgi:nicotinamidase-related amidase
VETHTPAAGEAREVGDRASTTLTLRGRYYRHYPLDAPLGEAEETLELDIDETVFLLVDVYGKVYDEDFVPPDDLPNFYKPTPGDPRGEIVRTKIAPAKAAAKRAALRVVYLTNYLSPGISEGTEWRNMSIRTAGVDVLEAWVAPNPILEHAAVIAPEPGEPLIPKQLYSGFFETHLDSLLRSYRARNLVVVGFDSRICLATTVTEAMYRNYRVIVLRDATHTMEYPETEAAGSANFLAIRYIEATVGYTATTEDFIRGCDVVASVRASANGAQRTST